MNENLITDNNNDNINNTMAREKILFKEVKKMTFIKYLNLFISIFRFFLMFYLLTLLPIIPSAYESDIGIIIYIILLLFNILILPTFTIIVLIIVIAGVLGRSFVVNKKKDSILDILKCFCCYFCGSCPKNVETFKISTIIFGTINLIWFFHFLPDLFQKREPNYIRFFPYITKQYIIKTLLTFLDSVLLFLQSYFFYYHEYFLRRGEIYIEFYKRLIIKNRNKEAELVRNELPNNLENIGLGTELQNV